MPISCRQLVFLQPLTSFDGRGSSRCPKWGPVDEHMLETRQVFEGPHGPQQPAMAQLLSQMTMLLMHHCQWVLRVADHLDIDGICIHQEPYSIANTTLVSDRMPYWQVKKCLFVSNSWSHRTENPRSEQVQLLYYLLSCTCSGTL